MLLMKDRSFLYELRAYLIYVKVGERSFLYELRAYLVYVKVGESAICADKRYPGPPLRQYVGLLFCVHGKQLWSCRDGQLT